MGKLAIGAKASIISKLFVIPRLQPRRHIALTEARSHSRLDVVPRGATMARAKEVATVNTRTRSDNEKLGPIRSNNYIWW